MGVKSIIVSIHKKDELNDVNNYRVMCLAKYIAEL